LLTRIEVGQKSPATDSNARKILTAIRETFRLPVDSAAAVSVYTLEMDLSAGDKERAAPSPASTSSSRWGSSPA
jgi:hypothetical protein